MANSTTKNGNLFWGVAESRTNISPSNITEEAWFRNDLDIGNWNSYFPYGFLVVKILGNNTFELDRRWKFDLPIPPENYTIQTPFAVNTIVTLGGIIEEHNASPIRMITLSGSTGVIPLRGSAPVKEQLNTTEAIFGGTIVAAAGVATSARTISDIFTGEKRPQNVLGTSDITKDNEQGSTTGYIQFHLLKAFLEKYAAFKKTADGRNSVLAFNNQKDKELYLVSIQSFVGNRVANSPFEYHYTIQLKAWRRININANNTIVQLTTITKDPNKLARALRVFSESRNLLEKFRGVLTGISTDISNVLFTPLREATLFTKDLIGSSVSIMDLPTQIVKNARTAIVANIALNKEPYKAAKAFTDKANDLRQLADSFADVATEAGIVENQNTNLGSFNQALFTPTSPIANKVLENPEDNYEALKDIKISSLNLEVDTLRQIVDERNRIAKLTRLDFEQHRDKIQEFAISYANAVGAGSTGYNKIYGRNDVVSNRTPSEDDFNILFALNNTIMELNRLALSEETNQFISNRVDFIAGLASRSGIAFTTPKSKFMIPFPYGSTLEQLAAKYLNDSNRWHEIAALNGLHTPYIDEQGFDLPLLVNGNGNQIMVSDAGNLFIGQTVFLTSNNTTKTQRLITKIMVLSSSQAVITLNGDLDLSRFTTLATAKLSAFLPNTVNSQMTIFIPSDTESTVNDHKFKAIPGVEDFDKLLSEGGVDLLLTSSNDLAVTDDGNCLLAVGLTNIIQTARIRLSTLKGTLIRHPGFGLDAKPGQSIADLSLTDLTKSLKELFLDDPVFIGVQNVNSQLIGPAVNIGMSIGIKGLDKYLPVNFTIVT